MKKWFSFVLIVCTVATVQAAAGNGNGMNVLFITADDLGVQVGCYGETLIETPNIDQLAAGGVQFDDAYVSQASCSSSRSAMLTGLHAHSTGQYGVAGPPSFALHPEIQKRTIPNLLKPAGYYTGIIGKLHVTPEESFKFDYRVTTEDSKIKFQEPPDDDINCRDVRRIAAEADEFLQKKGDKPFFLMVNYDDPHALHRENENTFPPQVLGIPENPLPPSEKTVFSFQQVSSEATRVRVAGYYSAIMRLDVGIGMLMDVLEKNGHRDDTLIIFVGDHGAPFARGKTTNYEAGLRIPYIVQWPGVSKSMKSPALVSTVDILPTILDAIGVETENTMHGKSLRPVLSNLDAPWRKYLMGEHHFHGSRLFLPLRAVRDHRYKLIHNILAGNVKPGKSVDSDPTYDVSQQAKYDGTPARKAFDTFADPPEFELYDLQKDPNEFNNLAGNPEYKTIQKRLQQALIQERKATSDPFLDPAFLKGFQQKGERKGGKRIKKFVEKGG